MSSDRKYTPEELRTLYSVYPEISDVFVEGRDDADFYEVFLKKIGGAASEATVYAVSDRVLLTDGLIVAHGYETGQRGRVLTLAHLSQEWSPKERSSLTCIMDADRGYLEGSIPSFDGLLVTDGTSVECYALLDHNFEKFVRLALKEKRTSSQDVLAEVKRVATSAFCVRVALHEANADLSVELEHIKKMKLSSGVDLDEQLLQRVSLGALTPAEQSRVRSKLLSVRIRANALAPSRSVRGHDIAPAVICVLGLKNHWADPAVVEGALISSIDHGDLSLQPMFESLVRRLNRSA